MKQALCGSSTTFLHAGQIIIRLAASWPECDLLCTFLAHKNPVAGAKNFHNWQLKFRYFVNYFLLTSFFWW